MSENIPEAPTGEPSVYVDVHRGGPGGELLGSGWVDVTDENDWDEQINNLSGTDDDTDTHVIIKNVSGFGVLDDVMMPLLQGDQDKAVKYARVFGYMINEGHDDRAAKLWVGRMNLVNVPDDPIFAERLFRDHYQGHYDTAAKYAMHYYQEVNCDDWDKVPDDLRPHIEWEGVAKDMEGGATCFEDDDETHGVYVFYIAV